MEIEHYVKMGLTTRYFCYLESFHNSEKTKTSISNQLTGLYMGQGIQEWAK